MTVRQVAQVEDVEQVEDLEEATPAAPPAWVEGGRGSRRTAGQRIALGTLRAYQAARVGHVSPCRFYPSCSVYAVEAVERHGARRGVWLAVRRVARCRPLGGRGVDLVPLETRRRRRGGR